MSLWFIVKLVVISFWRPVNESSLKIFWHARVGKSQALLIFMLAAFCVGHSEYNRAIIYGNTCAFPPNSECLLWKKVYSRTLLSLLSRQWNSSGWSVQATCHYWTHEDALKRWSLPLELQYDECGFRMKQFSCICSHLSRCSVNVMTGFIYLTPVFARSI